MLDIDFNQTKICQLFKLDLEHEGVLTLMTFCVKSLNVENDAKLCFWVSYVLIHIVLQQALAQAIRFHPKVPGVWIYAAAWEFDNNLNAAAARALMHSGLRACPTSEDLWVEYLRMELTYLNKLKARKVVLGEDEGTLARSGKNAKEEQWRDENKELFMALDDKREDDKLSNLHEGDPKEKVDLFREQGLSVLQTVYSGSIKALPSSFSLRTQFLEILAATDLAHSEDMRNEILADMKRDFSEEPKYWDWLARQEVIDLSNPESTEAMTADQLSTAIQVTLNLSCSRHVQF